MIWQHIKAESGTGAPPPGVCFHPFFHIQAGQIPHGFRAVAGMDSVLCGGPNLGITEPGREPSTEIEQEAGPQQYVSGWPDSAWSR